jgi:hypothetical protein
MVQPKEYFTLCFKTNKQAEKNQKEIKTYFGSRLIDSEIKEGIDERNNSGFFVKYTIID